MIWVRSPESIGRCAQAHCLCADVSYNPDNGGKPDSTHIYGDPNYEDY